MTIASDAMLILASTSRYRRALLERLQIPFAVEAPDVDETPLESEAPDALAARLSRAKALKVANENPDALVLGSDQVASCGPLLLHKAGSVPKAVQQLSSCSGKTVTFATGVVLARGEQTLEERVVFTSVTFRTLDEQTLQRYAERDKPLDCAGSFRWEGLGIALFEKIQSDDPTALEGLPLISVTEMLGRHGISVL
ncbi:MAG: nucleoside triphosphate pyrophosphatase [Pseudomonadota bacterium]